MVDDRASPSTGWRECYERMGVDDERDDDRDEPPRCSECGLVVERATEHRCPLDAESVDNDTRTTTPARSGD